MAEPQRPPAPDPAAGTIYQQYLADEAAFPRWAGSFDRFIAWRTMKLLEVMVLSLEETDEDEIDDMRVDAASQ